MEDADDGGHDIEEAGDHIEDDGEDDGDHIVDDGEDDGDHIVDDGEDDGDHIEDNGEDNGDHIVDDGEDNGEDEAESVHGGVGDGEVEDHVVRDQGSSVEGDGEDEVESDHAQGHGGVGDAEVEDHVVRDPGSSVEDVTMDADAEYPGQSQAVESESMEVVDIDEDDTADEGPSLLQLIKMDELPEATPVLTTTASEVPAATASKVRVDKARKAPKFYRTKKVSKFPGRAQEESYENMSPETKADYKRAAQEAIDQFLRYPNTTSINHRLRKLIHENQDFMPHVVNKTRRLTLELLTSNRNNVICHYHH
ncbi:hypothetical protein H0H92_012507, partial [Tricholoma furcatifolium]